MAVNEYTSTPALLVNDVHAICGLTQDTLAVLMPGGDVVRNSELISENLGTKISQDAVHVYQLLEKGEPVVDALRSNTDELTVTGILEAARQAGFGRAAAAADMLNVLHEHMKNEQDAAESRVTVQQQIAALTVQLNELSSKVDEMRDNMVVVEALKDAVIAACDSGKPIQTPEFAQGYVQSQPSTPLGPSIPQSANTLPWWATLSSIHPSMMNSGKQVQGKTVQPQPVARPNQTNCPTSTDLVGPGGRPGCP